MGKVPKGTVTPEAAGFEIRSFPAVPSKRVPRISPQPIQGANGRSFAPLALRQQKPFLPDASGKSVAESRCGKRNQRDETEEALPFRAWLEIRSDLHG
jgi:hypothetical protein